MIKLAKFMTQEKKPVCVDFGKKVRINFNTNVSDSQRDSNVVAKVTVVHPVFATRGTIFKSRYGLSLLGSGIRGRSRGDQPGSWFSFVNFEDDFAQWVIEQFVKQRANQEIVPSYLAHLGKHSYDITAEAVNKSLDILEIVAPERMRMTDKQRESGLLGKLNVRTSIATIRQISMFLGRPDKHSVYAVEPVEMYTAENGADVKNPAFRLSEAGKDQICNFAHSLTNFEEEAEAEKPNDFEALLQQLNIPQYKERTKTTPSQENTGEEVPVEGADEVSGDLTDIESAVFN